LSANSSSSNYDTLKDVNFKKLIGYSISGSLDKRLVKNSYQRNLKSINTKKETGVKK
jgi:hypothetical protein